MHGHGAVESVYIAIVDDDEAILDSLRLLLDGNGWEVRTYTTGEAFLDDLVDSVPSCLILDAHLPGISGAEVARAISKGKWSIPIIGWTARPGSRIANDVLSEGAQVMLTKPVIADAIISHVQTALGSV